MVENAGETELVILLALRIIGALAGDGESLRNVTGPRFPREAMDESPKNPKLPKHD